MENKTHSAGSKPARKRDRLPHVVVYEGEHSEINNTVGVLAAKFIEKAKALGIPIRRRGIYRNVPGQADAVRYRFSHENLERFVDSLIRKAQGAQ